MLDYLTAGSESAPTVVMCHGFGANMHDLTGLAREIEPTVGVRWIFPQAPAELPGYPAGRAWFPRTAPELHAFASGSDFRDLSSMDPDGLRASGRELLELLTAVGVDLSQTVIGGFSQGAMVAVEAVLEAARMGPQLPAGLIVLSGSLIAAERWVSLAPSIASVPMLQSHGSADPVLPFAQALRLRDLLSASGASVDFVEFDGGHAIPSAVLTRIGEFVRFTSSAATPCPGGRNERGGPQGRSSR